MKIIELRQELIIKENELKKNSEDDYMTPEYRTYEKIKRDMTNEFIDKLSLLLSYENHEDLKQEILDKK